MKTLITVAALLLAAALLFAALTPPAEAQECASIPDIVTAIEADGGQFVDLLNVRSDHFDQLLVVVAGGMLLIGGVKDGCVVTSPIPLDTVAPVTPA